jgi:hypothetical protein
VVCKEKIDFDVYFVVMIKQAALFAAIVLTAFSCSKNKPATPTPPVKDTAYLRKTLTVYSYDLSGMKTADSSIEKWTYDSKGRPTLDVRLSYDGGYIDSSTFTYTSSQTTTDAVIHSNGFLISQSHSVLFLDARGRADSITEIGTNYNSNNGVITPSSYNTVSVYYKDANGNDTLDVAYNLSTGGRMKGGIVRKTYDNNMLSTVEEIAASGIKTYAAQWTDGNIMSDTEWSFTDGTQFLSHIYTYTTVLSGGFYGYNDTKNLMATFTSNDVLFPSNSYTGTNTYTFDDANRVSTMTQTYSNTSTGSAKTLSIYTYY